MKCGYLRVSTGSMNQIGGTYVIVVTAAVGSVANHSTVIYSTAILSTHRQQTWMVALASCLVVETVFWSLCFVLAILSYMDESALAVMLTYQECIATWMDKICMHL